MTDEEIAAELDAVEALLAGLAPDEKDQLKRQPNRVTARRMGFGWGEVSRDRSRIRRLTKKQRMARK